MKSLLKKKKEYFKRTLKELKNISAYFEKDVFEHIKLENSVQKKNVYGGTAKKQVEAQIARIDKKLRNKPKLSHSK